MYRTESSQKVLVLGVDGFEPRLAKKFLMQEKCQIYSNLSKKVPAVKICCY